MEKILKKMKPLEKLDLKDRFLFDQVAEDPECCQAMLEIILDKEITILMKNETEKEFRTTTSQRSIKMDVFAADAEDKIYNMEMQQKNAGNLARRGRFYQAHLDVSLLEPGVIDFNELNDSYMIMIACFDLFGFGKYRYTCRMECKELPGTILEDGAVRIFLNTKGTDRHGVSQELIDFLHYVECSTDEVCGKCESARIQRIHKRVCSIKRNEEVGVRYLQQWEEKIMIREEGIEKGIKKGIEKGEQKKAIDIAKNLIDILDVEVIATKTGLSVETVQQIKAGQIKQEEELGDAEENNEETNE